MISIKKIIADSVDKMHKGMEYEDNLSESFVEERFHNLYIKSCISYNYELYEECLIYLIKSYKEFCSFDATLFCYTLFQYSHNNNCNSNLILESLIVIAETKDLYKSNQVDLIKKSIFAFNSDGKLDKNSKKYIDKHLSIFCDPELLDNLSKDELRSFDLSQTSVNTLVNCLYNESSSGIGDFLRGCCFLFEQCKLYNINFRIDFSKHDISKYIKSKSKNKFKIEDIFDTEKINKELCTKENYIENIKNNLINVLQRSTEDKVFLFTNYSDFIDCNLSLDRISLTDKCQNFMQANLIFSKNVLKEWKRLIHFQNTSNYEIVHFRLGDKYLLNTADEDSTELFASLVDIINNINPKGKLFILSDSNKFKEYCRHNISNKNVGILHTRSQHCSNAPGSIDNLDSDKQKKIDNMFYVALDMKFLSCADKVYSYSVYPWGSGFSFWICKIFGVDIESHPIQHDREGTIDWTEQ